MYNVVKSINLIATNKNSALQKIKSRGSCYIKCYELKWFTVQIYNILDKLKSFWADFLLFFNDCF